jgi:hypothetical protein
LWQVWAREVEQTGRSVAVGTTNPRHLSRFMDARISGRR